MDVVPANTLAQWVTAGILGLAGMAYGLQNIVKSWKSNTAESGLLTMMHEELERMSSQNTALSKEIGVLQGELVKLSNQLTTLTIENQKLQSEVSNLNKEIIRLHGVISEKAVT